MATDNSSIIQARHQLANGPPPAKGGEWVIKPDFHETRKLAGASFAGTADVSGEPTCEWAIGHVEEEWFDEDQRQDLLSFCLGFAVYDYFRHDPLVICKRVNGKLAYFAIVYERGIYQKKGFRETCADNVNYAVALAKIMGNSGIPKLYSDSKYKKSAAACDKKFDSITEGQKKSHQCMAPKDFHWYVAMVGVHPDFNKQGLGRELMEKLGELADKAGMICMLESGERNMGFYKKMGYSATSVLPLEDPTGQGKDCPGSVMWRHPTNAPSSRMV